MTPHDLAARRHRLGWRQKDLGLVLGATVQTVCSWERGGWRIPQSVALLLRFASDDDLKRILLDIETRGIP